MQKNKIKAILFDSGKVLNFPASGHWFITPNFFDYVEKEKFDGLDEKRISHAFKKANKYIDTVKLIQTREEELEHFTKFYRIFATELSELNLSSEKIELLAKDLVYNPEKYVFYDDALQVLSDLRGKYKLGIVSDAWPSLRDVYVKQGLDTYFDSFVISSLAGVTKPDEKMYTTALHELGVLPKEAVFVDDNLENCVGAGKLGIHSVLLCRNNWVYRWNKLKSIGKRYCVINTLKQLNEIL